MPDRRTTKAEYARFKKAFIAWQRRLGLMEWQVYFAHAPIRDAYGDITADHLGGCATVRMAAEIAEEAAADFDPERTAKHEALELLVSPMEWLARSRAVMEEDIERETHRLVRRLEHVLT